MLKEIFIENYKSLKKAKVEFKDGLNIIIGKNGSGKSNLLEFIDMSVISLIPPELDKNFKLGDNYYSYTIEKKDKEVLKITVETKFTSDKKELNSDIVFFKNSHKKFLSIERLNSHNTYQINNNLQGIPNLERLILLEYADSKQLIRFNIPTNISIFNSSINYTISLINNFYKIDSNDNNFLLGIMFRNSLEFDILTKYVGDLSDLKKFKKFILNSFNTFKKEINIDRNLILYSPIEDIKITENINLHKIVNDITIDNITIEYKINGTWTPWTYLSDGTKRLFYMIAEMICQNDGIILIEEPELGIHPHQLYKLMQFIKEQSEHKQIIISTHSPLVLDTLDPDELDRITIAKIENGGSQFHKLTDEQKHKAGLYMEETGELSYYWLHSDLEDEN